MAPQNLRSCENGHTYYKSSDCPTCPKCEAQCKPKTGFLSLLSAPARRALENADITTLEKLSKHSEATILKLHGIGKTTVPILREALAAKNLTFAKQNQ